MADVRSKQAVAALTLVSVRFRVVRNYGVPDVEGRGVQEVE